MINKIYVEMKKFIKENYLVLLFGIVFMATILYPLPYYIYTGGGTINVKDKIHIESKETKGDFNLCYVEQINANIPTFLLSKLLSNWDSVSKEEVSLNDKEDVKDIYKRDKIYLEEANQNAIFVAYKKAGKSVNILDKHLYIIYLEEDSDTDLKIGDDILEIDGSKIDSLADISKILDSYEVGSKLNIKVKRNGKEMMKYAIVHEKDGRKLIGIALTSIYDYEVDPKITFTFSNSESGPSGGFMVTLAIYNQLIDSDISNGLKIAGTGTIDIEGNVGSIGGVKYKLKGAVDSKSDIFLVPAGENYEEAIKYQKKYHYDIKIIGISTFEEAIEKLESMK
ncbi:PDZ domain-containing protein [bacterium]|nr:PDZ domain-containing protein [bacterium]